MYMYIICTKSSGVVVKNLKGDPLFDLHAPLKRDLQPWMSCDIRMLQDTWALTSNVGKLNQHFIDLNTYGISSVTDNVLLSGRPQSTCRLVLSL